MSKLIKKQTSFLRLFIETSSNQQRKALLNTVTDDQLKALTEITYNLLQDSIPVTAAQKKKLRTYKRLLVLLGDPKTSPKKKKRALCRQTKGITLLLRTVEPTLKTFLG